MNENYMHKLSTREMAFFLRPAARFHGRDGLSVRKKTYICFWNKHTLKKRNLKEND